MARAGGRRLEFVAMVKSYDRSNAFYAVSRAPRYAVVLQLNVSLLHFEVNRSTIAFLEIFNKILAVVYSKSG